MSVEKFVVLFSCCVMLCSNFVMFCGVMVVVLLMVMFIEKVVLLSVLFIVCFLLCCGFVDCAWVVNLCWLNWVRDGWC